jgi:Transposase DDE domain
LRRASRSTRSGSGKALLRKRGEHLERSFAHLLDHGGLRRATLRGCEKLTKRHMAAALTYNLSLLMRTLFGVGTPKQAMAGARQRLLAALRTLSRIFSTLTFTLSLLPALRRLIRHPFSLCPPLSAASGDLGRFSTGC